MDMDTNFSNALKHYDLADFREDPRSYALGLVDEGLVDPLLMLSACLKYMSHGQVQDMLEANELAPRFWQKEEDDE
jgi:hypothetical protein